MGGFVQWQSLVVERPEHAAGRSRGGLRAKIHRLVLGAGLPLVTVGAPGHSGDCPIRLPLLDQLRVRPLSGRPRTRAGALRGNKAYCERPIRRHLRPPTTMPTTKARNVVERRLCHLEQRPALATGYDKLGTVYCAATVLDAIIAWTRAFVRHP
jgi:hypothetical protein